MERSYFHFLAARPVKIYKGPLKLRSTGQVGQWGKSFMAIYPVILAIYSNHLSITFSYMFLPFINDF